MLANLRALLAHRAGSWTAGVTSRPTRWCARSAGRHPRAGRADPQAVRLLTIHGAKGLEADAVLLLDTDTPRAPTPTPWACWWTGRARPPAPRRFVFLASETSPPACAADTLAAEQAERAREELNALYVALTRARQVLALSAVEPHRDSGRSPWRRIEPLAQAVEAVDWLPQPCLMPRSRPQRHFSCLLCPCSHRGMATSSYRK